MMKLMMMKRAGTLILLSTAIFCLDATAVNNPVSYETEINDCDVIKYNGEYYIQGNWLKGDMLNSRDLVSWGQRKHVFSWSNTWHTQVNQTNPDYDIHGTHIRYHNGTFHLYAHLDVTEGITHATSSDIWGPYTEPVDAKFADWIDAETFKDDDGSLYFYSTQLASGEERNYGYTMSDPNTITGSRDLQIDPNGGWEGTSNINEGPNVFKYRGRYYMLYNAYPTSDPNYAIGCVEATSPLGFGNSGKYSAPVISRYTPPGHDEIAYIGQPWMIEGLNGFEKWLGYFAQTASEGRTQRIDRMLFFGRTLFVDGPTDRWTPGYHPAPAKPQLLNIFAYADGPLSSMDWIEQTAGTWAVSNEEAIQSDQAAWAFSTVNRDAAANYLIEANLKFTQAQDSEDKAGVLAYYQDADNYVLVGLNRVADQWYVHVRENGVDTVQAGSYAGSVDYSVYHKIRVVKNAGIFDVRIDEMIPPGFSLTSTGFGAGTPGIFTDHAAAAFDGIIYTIGWDEYDSAVAGWGNSIGGLPMSGSQIYGADGVTVSSGLVYKGDLMPEYEFSAQIYQSSGTGSMGLAAVAVDSQNYLNAMINLATDKLVVSGVHNGVSFSEPEVSVANKADYNIRVAKLSDRVVIFVDGEEKITVNKAYAASPVGLIASGMDARFNGIMAYRTEPDVAPDLWVVEDVGTPGFSGTIERFDHALYMTGSGRDIWDVGDEFAFAQNDVSGDWELTTRVVAHDRTHYWAKAGLMFRDSLATNSPMVHLNVTPRDQGLGGVHLQWRDVVGGGTGSIDLFDLNYPIWIKLNRTGSTFTGSYSTNGQNWTAVGTISSPVNTSGKVGYSLCSLDNTRIAKAVFDNSELVVSPPSPGSIGDSQMLYLDEDPAPFVSIAPASGSGSISYQWQWTLVPGDELSWADLGATNETYDLPVLGVFFSENTEVFIRRKAKDVYGEAYSNILSLKLIKPFVTTGSYLFVDDFDTIDAEGANSDYATRQAGGGGTSPYSGFMPQYSIVGGKLKNSGSAGFLALDANVGRYIAGEDFEFSFNVTIPDTSGNWSSIYLQDEVNVGDVRADSRLGIYFLGAANSNFIGAIYKGVGAHEEEVISVGEVAALTGVPYNKADEHTFQFISYAGPGGTNTYDLVIDGVKVRTGLPYYFDGAERRIGVVGVMAEGSLGALYDDISLRFFKTYTSWLDDHGLVGADALRTADLEPDGLNNLVEYALGGDPNVDDAASVIPSYIITPAGGNSTFVDYVYKCRLDADAVGLTYGLNISTNLRSAWDYVGATYETGRGNSAQGFESVTNEVPFSTDQGFIQLKIMEK